jgi:galactonate dehydratase
MPSHNTTQLTVHRVDCFVTHNGAGKNWVFVRVETEEGLRGWGECYTFPDREGAVRAFVEELGRYLIGRDAGAIKPFTHYALQDFAGKRGSVDLFAAISGIEQALWDLAGRASGQPVYRLLGGTFRTRFRVYANGWSMTPDLWRKPIDEVAEAARQLVTDGFTAVKFDPFPGAWRAHIGRDDERSAAQCVEAVRAAVGPQVDLLIECHRRLSAKSALRMAAIFEQFDPYWLEEPVAVDDVAALEQVRHATKIPVVTGETLFGKAQFRDVFAQRAADIINPDVSICGGILELREIASMAEAFTVAVSPHNYNSTAVSLAATLHASAGMPNYLITEYFVDSPTRDVVGTALDVVDGYVDLPHRPGLGLDLDEERLAAHPSRQLPLRAFG